MASIAPVKLDFKVVEPSVKKNKKDIILLHGSTATKAEFDDIINELANQTGRKIYAVDLRNHGDSGQSNIFSFEAMTADVIHFMDEHSIKSASLLGHSLGGRLAMVIALTHPNRVESIIIEDMTPKALPADLLEAYGKLIKLFAESIDLIPPGADIEAATAAVYENFFKNKPKEILSNVKTLDKKLYPLPIVKKDGKYAWKTNFPVMKKETKNLKFHEDLQGLCQKPALFLHGKFSEFHVGNDKDFILKLFPNAQLRELPTTHIVHSEAVEEFLQAVQIFLA